MFRNHIKIAFRFISKKKVQNLINVVGLICGITFLMIVAAYIWDAYQVNAELRNKDQQYLLQSSYKKEGFGLELTTIGALPKALKESYPNLVADYYRIDGLTSIVSNGEDNFEESITLGDPSLLTMFGFSLHEGNPKTALLKPFSVVLSEDAALKYFGELNIIGEELTISNFSGEKHGFMITGVIKQNAQNSVIDLTPSLHADIFLPVANQEFFARDIDNWNNVYIPGFIELQPGVSPTQLLEPINTLVGKNKNKEFAENYSPQLKPLKSYYLDDNQGAVRKMINILLWISGFILLMAIINFVNFSIAQNINRLKEIGIRKIMGASSRQVAVLLLTEYIVLVFLISLFCIPLYRIVCPLFETVLMRKLPTLSELPIYFFFALFALSVAIGLLAGLYPALKLSKNGILASVKYQLVKVKTKYFVRHSLLFLQFTVAIIILISTVVISKQIQLFMEGNIGYNKDYLLTVQVPRDWSTSGVKKMETIRQELRQLSQIESISLSYETPNNLITQAKVLKNEKSNDDINAQMITADKYFAQTYQIPLLAGQFFNRPVLDTTANMEVVINKNASQVMGYSSPEEAIGQRISLFDGKDKAVITGVTDDFIANSMHDPSVPIVWLNVAEVTQYRYLSIRLKPGSLATSIAQVEEKWKQLLPDAPFAYQFMDDRIKKMYETELQLQRASQSATFISLLIISLGIMGLVSLAINARAKEVGMRKILGASITDLLILFSKEFYFVFFLAILTATPISYFIMQQWLQNFEFRIEISATTYLIPLTILTGLLSCVILVVLLRSTTFNPIDKLRDE